MAAKTVLNYLERDSVIHKMTGTTKLAFFLLFTFASMITYNTWVLLVLFAVSLAAFRISDIKYREVRFMMIFMLVFSDGQLIADCRASQVLCDPSLVARAALKETSLFTLANRCEITPPESFVERFIHEDREVRSHGR